MGGVGSILTLLIFVPTAGLFLGIAGFILTLIAINLLSKELNDQKIFSNMIISVILSIVAVIIFGVVLVSVIFRFLGLGSFVGQQFIPPANLTGTDLAGIALILLPGLAAVWILLIVSAFFLRRCYTSISTRLNVRMFDTAALIYLIGAILIIILIGFLLLIVAEILFIIAYFSIQEPSRGTEPAQMT